MRSVPACNRDKCRSPSVWPYRSLGFGTAQRTGRQRSQDKTQRRSHATHRREATGPEMRRGSLLWVTSPLSTANSSGTVNGARGLCHLKASVARRGQRGFEQEGEGRRSEVEFFISCRSH